MNKDVCLHLHYMGYVAFYIKGMVYLCTEDGLIMDDWEAGPEDIYSFIPKTEETKKKPERVIPKAWQMVIDGTHPICKELKKHE